MTSGPHSIGTILEAEENGGRVKSLPSQSSVQKGLKYGETRMFLIELSACDKEKSQERSDLLQIYTFQILSYIPPPHFVDIVFLSLLSMSKKVGFF